jgi:hypothetical protein
MKTTMSGSTDREVEIKVEHSEVLVVIKAVFPGNSGLQNTVYLNRKESRALSQELINGIGNRTDHLITQ